MNPAWPGDDELRQLLDGSLTSARHAEIEALLDQDDALRAHLERLAGGSSWIGRASDSGRQDPHEPVDSDAALLAAIGGLKAQATAATMASDTHRPQMSLSFLAPSEKPGSLGRLGHYEVFELIGVGGFGLVLKAHDCKLNRIVAIKVLSPGLANHATPRRRFLKEAEAGAAIKHEDVVTIYHIEDQHQPPFIVMEYVAGISLQQLIDRDGPLPVAKILRIGAQAAEGLAAAHKQGLIHRDVKPANILLENGVQRVKLTDFGLARAVDEASLTQSGVVAGTPQYMAPEQARGETVDYRSDLFSLGSVLYTMCAGRPAFRADSAVAVLKRVCEDAPRPLREINAEIPAWLEAIIGKLMAKAPNDRFTSAREVAELLDQCLAHVQQPRLVELPAGAAKLAASVGVATPRTPVRQEVDRAAERERAKRLVRAPAIAMRIVGIINWIAIAIVGGLGLSFGGVSFGEFKIISIVMGLLTLASMVIVWGASQALALRRYTLAIVTAILCMTIAPGSVIGLFIGIWALAVLLRREVRDAFEQVASDEAAGADPPRKPAIGALPYAQPAPANSSARIAALTALFLLGGVAMLCLLPIIGLGVPLYMARSVSRAPVPATSGNGTISVLCAARGWNIEIKNLGNNQYGGRWQSDDYRARSEGHRWDLPEGNYRIVAHDAAGAPAFERTVRIATNRHERVEVVRQADPIQAVNLRPTQGGLSLANVGSVAMAPDGKRVALSLDNSLSVAVFETERGTEIVRFAEFSPTLSAFSHDGKLLASVGKDGADVVVLLQNFSDQNVRKLKPTGKHTEGKYALLSNVKAIAFSPDGETLAVSSAYNWDKEKEEDSDFRSVIHRFNVKTGEELPPLVDIDGTVEHLVFPATKSDLLVCAANSDNPASANIILWDLSASPAKLLGRIWEIERSIDGVALSPQGGWIYKAYASNNQSRGGANAIQVRPLLTRNPGYKNPEAQRGLWDAPAQGFIELASRPHALATSRDGKLLAIANDLKTIELWQATSPQRAEKVGELLHANYGNRLAMAFTADSSELVITSSNGELRRWNVSPWTGEAKDAQASTTRPTKPRENAITLARTNDAEGAWRRRDDALVVTPSDVSSYCSLPITPGDEYVLKAKVERTHGTDGLLYLSFGFVAHGRPMQISFDNLDDEHWRSALGSFDGNPPHELETERMGQRFMMGKQHDVRITVRQDIVIATVDDAVVVTTKLPTETRTVRRATPSAKPDPFFVEAGMDAGFRLAALEVLSLDEAAKDAFDIAGKYDSRWGEILLRHPTLAGGSIVELTGEYYGGRGKISGTYDPAARVLDWTFAEGNMIGGVCRQVAGEKSLNGTYYYSSTPSLSYQWDMTLVSTERARPAAQPPNADGLPALQKLMLLAESHYQRAKETHALGTTSSLALADAEIKWIEATARYVEEVAKVSGTESARAAFLLELENLNQAWKRKIDLIDKLVAAGTVTTAERSLAQEKLLEAEYRLKTAQGNK